MTHTRLNTQNVNCDKLKWWNWASDHTCAADSDDDEVEEVIDDSEDDYYEEPVPKKKAASSKKGSAAKGGRGRPKKATASGKKQKNKASKYYDPSEVRILCHIGWTKISHLGRQMAS